MAARRSSATTDPEVPSAALLRRHVGLAKYLYKKTGELDGFAPRKFIGIDQKTNKQIFRILEVEELIPELHARNMFDADIIQTRNQYMSKKLELPEPFPSSPTRPPKFNIKFIRSRDSVAVIAFCEIYAAQRVLEEILQDTPHHWESDDEIVTEDGLLIRSPTKGYDLSTILEHKPTQPQQLWELPFPYPMMIRAIRNRSYVPPVTHFADTLPGHKEARTATQAPIERSTIERPRKTRQPRPERQAGATTIATLAEQCDLPPTKARQALRKANIDKPASGWEWTNPDDIQKILTILKKTR